MLPSDAARLAELTLALCAIPSVAGDEATCADFVASFLGHMHVERVGNTVLARAGGRPRPLVLLAGHTDTVPLKSLDGEIVFEGERKQFTVPPSIQGERIYGLGASDMKGGLAVMLHLAATLPLDDLPYELGLIFYDREEGPWLESGLGPAFEQVSWLREAALAFCLEPSDNGVQVGCVGSLHATVRFLGRAAHSARPWQGENAIHKAAPLLGRLAARLPVDVVVDGFLFREVLSATVAKGGVGRNVVPDRFELNLNYRFAPGKSTAEAEAELREFVGEAEVQLTDHSPSGRVVTQNPLLQRYVRLNQPTMTAKQAWTDVARFSQEGVDAVNLGPGLTAQAHQAGEYAELPLIVACFQDFVRFFTADEPG